MALAHHYRILGLRTGASFEDVKVAYRNLVRLYHPDVNPGDHLAKEKFIQVTQSYQALADAQPEAVIRATAKSKMAPDPAPATAPASPNPGQSGFAQPTPSPPAAPKIGQPPGGSVADQDLKQASFKQLQDLFRSQRYPRAVALVEGLVHRFPHDPEVRQWLAVTYYRWGQDLVTTGNFQKAGACLKKAGRLDPLNRSLQQSLQQAWQRLAQASQNPTLQTR